MWWASFRSSSLMKPWRLDMDMPRWRQSPLMSAFVSIGSESCQAMKSQSFFIIFSPFHISQQNFWPIYQVTVHSINTCSVMFLMCSPYQAQVWYLFPRRYLRSSWWYLPDLHRPGICCEEGASSGDHRGPFLRKGHRRTANGDGQAIKPEQRRRPARGKCEMGAETKSNSSHLMSFIFQIQRNDLQIMHISVLYTWAHVTRDTFSNTTYSSRQISNICLLHYVPLLFFFKCIYVKLIYIYIKIYIYIPLLRHVRLKWVC